MPTHEVMTYADGDVKFKFETTNETQVKEAMERFKDLVGNQKMWATTTDPEGKTKQVKSFDPNVDMVFHRQLQGG